MILTNKIIKNNKNKKQYSKIWYDLPDKIRTSEILTFFRKSFSDRFLLPGYSFISVTSATHHLMQA